MDTFAARQWVVHIPVITQTAISDCGFEQIDDPLYSPNMVASDYYLLENYSIDGWKMFSR